MGDVAPDDARLLFAGERDLLESRAGGGVLAHPFRVSAAGGPPGAAVPLPHSREPPRVVAAGAQGRTLLLLARGDGSLVLHRCSRRARPARGPQRLPSPGGLETAGLRPLLALDEDAGRLALLADGGELLAIDTRASEPRWEVLARGVAAAGPARSGGVLLARRDAGAWRLELAGPPAPPGPPVLVPEAGTRAVFGWPGRGELPWGLSALELERSLGGSPRGEAWLVAAGSARQQEIAVPPGHEVAGVARAKGSTGEPVLVVLRRRDGRVALVGRERFRALAGTGSPAREVALSPWAPLIAVGTAEGGVVVRALTGPGDRRLYRHRP